MNILAFESTAKVASAALSVDGVTIAVGNFDNGLSQSEILLPMAENLLERCHMSFDDVGLFACTVGPGSFTGVRIGVSVVKGLAFGRSCPCVGVSALESLAENLRGLSGIALPCMDARRGQFYNAIFRLGGGEVVRLTPDRAISGDELADEVKKFGDEKIYVCGDGYESAIKLFFSAGMPVCNTPPLLRSPSAASCAAVAYRKFLGGEYVMDTELSPVYLRLPQAERERLERLEKEERKNRT